MAETVLILGAHGRFGRTAAHAFATAGWQVRLHDRRQGDLVADAAGVQVIVNGWNPPYPQWEAEVPGLTARVIAAARATGATVIVPGNVYVYGPHAPLVLREETPHAAVNPLGRVRIEMEAAYRASGVRTILVRAGDFIDGMASGNWFDKVLAAKAARGRFVWPGDPDVPHAFAWLPDVARAAAALAERRETLPAFTEVGFPGYTLSGRDLANLCGRVLQVEMRVKSFPWALLSLARPFWPMAHGLFEMRYLWSMPHRVDGTRFAELLPDFQTTSIETALASALRFQIDPDQPVTRGDRGHAGQRIVRHGPEDAGIQHPEIP